MDGSKKKALSLTALIMSQISGRWPSTSNPPINRAEPPWGSSNKLHCQQAVTDHSVTAATAQATGVIRLLPQTYSSVRLSCMLSCHRIEGREVCRGSWASPPRLPGLWGTHQEPLLVFTGSCSWWFASVREAIASQPPRLLTILLIGLQIWRASTICPWAL